VRPQVVKQAWNGNWSFLQAVINGAFHRAGRWLHRFCRHPAPWPHDYHGWLVVEAEQDPVVAPSYEYADKGYRTCPAWWRPSISRKGMWHELVGQGRQGARNCRHHPGQCRVAACGFPRRALEVGEQESWQDAGRECLVVLTGRWRAAGAVLGQPGRAQQRV
jgi:hypothetical protein